MLFQRFADHRRDNSAAMRSRRARFEVFLSLIEDCDSPVRILDIGGTPQYWDRMLSGISLDKDLDITLLNPKPFMIDRPGFKAMVGDGRSLPEVPDRHFDIVFSNSTIEHVGSLADQERMAREMQRVARKYYVQTPNRYFPIEPHFVFPLFQFLPTSVKVWLAQHFNLGWRPKMPDYDVALREVTSIRLLTRREVKRLFPHAAIYDDTYAGLVKSFVAYTPR